MEKSISFLNRNRIPFLISGFIFGVLISSFISIGQRVGYGLFFVHLFILVFLFFARNVSVNQPIAVVLLFLMTFSMGIIRFAKYNEVNLDPIFESAVGKEITLQSIVLKEPEEKVSYRQYIVKAPKGDAKVLVRGEIYPVFNYGDEVKFTGRLEKPKNFETDQGKDFDYTSYLKKDKVYYIISFAKGELVSEGSGNWFREKLFTLKNNFVKNINNLIPDPESSLLAGILLGLEDSLGNDLEDAFIKTGVVHIVVLSGYNITIVAESLIKFFSFVPKNFALAGGAFGIILFSLMVGGSPSVVRASLMAILVLLARGTGRKYDIGRALLIVGFVMIFLNPNILIFDISFQLSFLSTIALIWISPIIKNKFKIIPERFAIREIFSATLATQFFVLPLLLYKMGEFSLVGLPVNLLILGFIPAIMFFGFVAGSIGFVSLLIATPFAFLSYLLLAYILKIVDIFSAFSFASFHIPHFSLSLMIVFYLSYGYLFFRYFKNRKGALQE